MLKEQNGRLVDEATGEDVVLHGVNRNGLECWSDNSGIFDIVRVALEEWHADTIRLPLSQDRWFGYDKAYTKEEYRAIVDKLVDFITKDGNYVILDAHYGDYGIWGKRTDEAPRMADLNTVTFWRDIGKRYANHPYVLYNLYNEPEDISWEVWRDGGWLEQGGMCFQAAGMQQLIDAVRDTGAKNPVVLGGLVWASSTIGPAIGWDVDDRGGNGIIMDAHIYPWNGLDWDADFASVVPTHPLLIGEFGHQGTAMDLGPACIPREPHEVWMPKLIRWIEENKFSYCAWDFDCYAGPCLLKEMENFTPTESHGVYVKDMLYRAWVEKQQKAGKKA